MTIENPFDGREYDGRVFRDRHDRNFFIGRLSPRQREEWLRKYPDRWQTREEFLRDRQSRTRTDIEAKPPEVRSPKSINEVRSNDEPTVRCRMKIRGFLTNRPRTHRRRR
jgi:hypothetical protein